MKQKLVAQPGGGGTDLGCCNAHAPVAVGMHPGRAASLTLQLKAVADPTRLRMLDLIASQEMPLCICDLTRVFRQQQPTISHHVRLLREAGLIQVERRGVWSYLAATEHGKRLMDLVAGL